MAFTAAIVAVTLVRADAVPGILDPSFGFDGRVLSTVNADPAAIAIDHLGRMVVVGTRKVNGHSQIVVARFDPPDAVSLDLTFGDFGIAIGNFGGNNVDNVAVGVAIDDVNRVIVAGYTTFGAGDRDFLIARFTAQGVPDVTFNPGGTIGFRAYGMGGQDEARAMAVDSHGRIVVVGSRRGDQENCSFLDRLLGLCIPGDDIAVLRAMPNGDPDGSFGDGGKAAFDFHDLDEATAVAIDQQDRIVVVGASLPVEQGVATDVEVLRLATNGSLDGSFDHNGSVLFFLNNKHYSAAATVAIDRFGKIVIGAVVADNVHLTTFHPLVENFNATADFALARLNDDGSFDQTFGTNGVAQFVDVAGFDDVPRAMAIDAAGRIVLAGSATSPTSHEDFALVRFTEAGILDVHYAVNGIVTTDVPHSGVPGSDQVRGLAFDSQGRAVAAGVSSAAVDAPFFALARYQVERPDYSFSPITPLTMPVGGSTATTVTVNSIEDFTSPVRLHISRLPDGTELRPGFSASINGGPNQVQLTPPLDGSASATLTMGADVTVVPGPYSFFVVSDDDSPGHPHSLFFQVNVTTSLTTAASVVTAFETAGAIDNHGVANALQEKLAHAQESSDAGDVESAENTLGAFMNQVKAQSGKHIAATATINGVTFSPPAVLLEHARDVLAHLKTQNVPNPVTGFVTTSTHGEIPDAVVSILDPTNAVVATATTDSTGFYYVANTSVLTPGTQYTVEVTSLPKGFTRSTPTSQVLHWLSTAVSLPEFVLEP